MRRPGVSCKALMMLEIRNEEDRAGVRILETLVQVVAVGACVWYHYTLEAENDNERVNSRRRSRSRSSQSSSQGDFTGEMKANKEEKSRKISRSRSSRSIGHHHHIGDPTVETPKYKWTMRYGAIVHILLDTIAIATPSPLDRRCIDHCHRKFGSGVSHTAIEDRAIVDPCDVVGTYFR